MEEVILLTSRCNQRCTFCFRLFDDPDRPLEDIRHELDETAAKGVKDIVFSGGEPTLHPGLPDVAEYARATGLFNTVALQTNATTCSSVKKARRLKDSGINRILVPFHSHIEEISDFLTQAPGTWKKTVAGIKNINEAGLPLTLNIVVNSINYRSLREYIEFITSELPFIRSLTISVSNPDGSARLNPWIVPRYSEVGPALVKAHRLCMEKGLISTNPDCGVPMCFLGGIESVSSEYSRAMVGDIPEAEREIVKKTSDAHKIKPPVCHLCVHDSICAGVWKAYADIHGLDEIMPVGENEEDRPSAIESGPSPAACEYKDRPSDKTIKLKISRACNNNCIFCSKADEMDGTFIDRAEVEKALAGGRSSGAVKVKFTGGEPSIHPDFIHLITVAKSIGYKNVSVSTNGRMFSYDKFCRKTINAGLDHAAVSLHSDTPDIHEGITCAKNSFSQTVRGVSNLVKALGPEEVDLRMVLCVMNTRTVYSTLREFHKLGIGKIELRHQVPFGRAFDGVRAPSQLRLKEISSALSSAINERITFASRGIPPESMGGGEGLIEPPTTLYGDAEKRIAPHLEEIFSSGTIPCEGIRCRFCQMEQFCNVLKKYISAAATGSFEAVETGPVEDIGILEKALPLCSARNVILRTDMPDTADRFAGVSGDTFSGITIDIPEGADTEKIIRGINPCHPIKRAVLREPVPRDAILEQDSFSVEIKINLRTVPWILENFTSPDTTGQVLFSIDTFSDPVEIKRNMPSLKHLLKHFPDGSRFIGIPECITSYPYKPPAFSFPIDILGAGSLFNLEEFVTHYIQRHYSTKSLQCVLCSRDSSCPGIHVNYIRTMGYRTFIPIKN